MFNGRVIDHQIDHDLDVAMFGLAQELNKISGCSETAYPLARQLSETSVSQTVCRLRPESHKEQAASPESTWTREALVQGQDCNFANKKTARSIAPGRLCYLQWNVR